MGVFMLDSGFKQFLDNQKFAAAVHHGKTETIIEMWEKGFDINTADDQGQTGLHHAVNSDQIESLKILLALGANPNIVNGLGSTPLYLAAKKGLNEIAAELVQSNADVDIANGLGETPLQVAIVLSHNYIAQILSSYSKTPATMFVVDMIENAPKRKSTASFDNLKEKGKEKENLAPAAPAKTSEYDAFEKALSEVPDELLCPVSFELMEDPVITPAGITYERKVAEGWIGTHHTEPTLRDEMPMEIKDLVPNRALKAAIGWYKALQKMLPAQPTGEKELFAGMKP